jgi:sugar/nucleoside kinase (ribokinase family)
MSLLIVGSLAFDTIETPWGRREKIVGGSGTYCSLAASFFTQPRIVAVVGEDFPAEIMKLFESRRIDTRGVELRSGKTFHWEGRYGFDPNQRTTVKTELNVFGDFRPRIPAEFKDNDIIFLANVDPDLVEVVLGQVSRPKLTALDTINFWIQTKPEALSKALERVDVFFANDEEVKMLTREVNLIRAAKKILERGPKIVITKKGEHGALVFGRDLFFGVIAHPCEEVVDPTGAGDSFAGGFLGYLDKAQSFGANKKEIRKAAVFGSVIASFAIEDFGIDRFRRLAAEEIEERFQSFKKLVSF